jgi:hypothetical protein
MSEVLWCLTGALLMAPRRAVPRISEKLAQPGLFVPSHTLLAAEVEEAQHLDTLLSRTRAGRRAFQSSSFRGCGQRGPFFVGRIHQFIHWSMHPRIGSMLSGVFPIFLGAFLPLKIPVNDDLHGKVKLGYFPSTIQPNKSPWFETVTRMPMCPY